MTTELAAEVSADLTGHPMPEQSGAFPPFDGAQFPSQLFWLAITFGVLYFLMVKVIVPRLGGIVEDRNNRIAGDLAEAGKLKAESETIIATYERELADARAEAQRIAEERRNAVHADLAERRKAAEATLATRLSEAEASIRGITERALAEVDGIAATTAEAVVAELAAVTADPAEAAAAVKRARG